MITTLLTKLASSVLQLATPVVVWLLSRSLKFYLSVGGACFVILLLWFSHKQWSEKHAAVDRIEALEVYAETRENLFTAQLLAARDSLRTQNPYVDSSGVTRQQGKILVAQTERDEPLRTKVVFTASDDSLRGRSVGLVGPWSINDTLGQGRLMGNFWLANDGLEYNLQYKPFPQIITFQLASVDKPNLSELTIDTPGYIGSVEVSGGLPYTASQSPTPETKDKRLFWLGQVGMRSANLLSEFSAEPFVSFNGIYSIKGPLSVTAGLSYGGQLGGSAAVTVLF